MGKKSMNCSTGTLVMMMIVILSLSSVPAVVGGIDYNSCLSQLIPCITYLFDGTPNPGPDCCTAAQALDNIAMNSLSDKTEFCSCIKKFAVTPPTDFNRAYQLPVLCNLKTPISPDIDC
ncbi:hypothetical protein POM88_002728 [Heracleum sosnowskyi]|uniref:Bifunctional inhibitor/plant lipid transfer protein/seed storage helical domain-containing protein n=1 Tax=Heracleum sosnowskyi TaxID=360622 RepID=A0AAD8JHB7_9APIA|nr:hypothetical protein POM88_002728 [Heracleum sosnowskyi]